MKRPLKEQSKIDLRCTNLTGMELLNRGVIRENELIDLGYIWNRDAYSYIKDCGKHPKIIRQINLLAYNTEEWNAIDK